VTGDLAVSLPGSQQHGFPAWLFVHLIYLVEFENRMLVLLQSG